MIKAAFIIIDYTSYSMKLMMHCMKLYHLYPYVPFSCLGLCAYMEENTHTKFKYDHFEILYMN